MTNEDKTLRKETGQREAEVKYRTLFEQSPDGILILDTGGKILDFNTNAHLQLGYSREEFAKLRIADLDPIESQVEIKNKLGELLIKGKGELDVKHRTKQGEIRDVHVITQTLVLSGQTVFHTIWRDITERKNSEKMLQKTNQTLGALIRDSPLAIICIDVDSNVLIWNPAAERIFGWSEEEVLGRKNPIIPEDKQDEYLRLREHVRQGNPYQAMELHRQKKDGTFIYLNSSSSALYDADGDVIALLGIFEDITERKHAEEALKNSEAFIKNILDTVDEGFIVIDPAYKILSANKAYLAQVKLPLESVLGRHCYEISHHIYRPCNEAGEDCAVRRTFDKGEHATAIHTHHDERGHPIIVEIKSYPIKNESGNVISVIEVINNITEKKKLENQLQHSHKMEAVGHLAGGVAHDFNNILTAIIGYGSLMKLKMFDDDPARYNLQQILDSAERAANLTRGLLAFSRKQVISPKHVNLNDIVKNIEKLILRLIGEDIDTTITLTDTELTVMADSGQIEQILMNLATNAKDAMPKGGCLTIRTEPVVLDRKFIRAHDYGKPGMYALISVTDVGIGMDEKTRGNIFEPFFTTKEVGHGTGLGLSIVYGIVKQHNGYITCYSEPGKGTTFKIYLPMIKGEHAETDTSALPPITGGTETVLVAEDDAIVRTLMKEMLNKYGYTVIEAVDGENAIRRFEENRDKIQLLILDVIMPKGHGKEVYEEIRRNRPEVKVIFTSGYTADIIHKRGILDEGYNFISKPISPTDLLRKMRETLDQA